MKLIQALKENKDSVLLLIFCSGLFAFLILYVRTDISAHLKHVENINAGEAAYPSNFAFYLVINILSGFSSIRYIECLNAIALLSFASVAKYLISKKIILNLNSDSLSVRTQSGVTIIALALFFCFAIPDPFSILVLKQYYLGRFVPMVWHNSTTIALFPFAILLFWEQLKVLNSSHKTSRNALIILNALVFMNAIIKPSFIIVYVPITVLFLIKKFKFRISKELILNLTPIITASAMLLIQTFFIYEMQLGSMQKEQSSVAISAPFQVITAWIPIWYVPVSIIMSFLLPIFTIAIYRKEVLRYQPFLYSLSLTVAGILVSAFIQETGPRATNGNFTWQNVICAHLIFLATISFLTPKLIDKSSWTRKELVVLTLFGLHTLSGIVYLIWIALTRSYL